MPEEEQPDDKILGDVTNLDTARMTLRWALERMRGLEKSNADIKDLLKQTLADREKTSLEMEGMQRLLEERLRKLEEKEHFVMEMQKMLNSIFQKQLDVGEFVERRQELEDRLKRLEQEKQAGLTSQNQRITELEAEQAEALKRQKEEHHRRMTALELEYSTKRQELQKDFDLLKQKLAEEHAACPGDAHLEATFQARWQAEREKFERQLAAREQELQRQQQLLKDLKEALYETQSADVKETTEQLKAVRRELTEALERQREENRLQVEQHEREMRERLKKQEQAFQAERDSLLEQLKSLETHQSQREEQALKLQALEKSAYDQSDEKIKAAMSQLETAGLKYQEALKAQEEERLKMEHQFQETAQKQKQEIDQLKAQLENQQRLFSEERAKLTQELRSTRGQEAATYHQVLQKVKKAMTEKENQRRLEAEATLDEVRFESEAEVQLLKNELEKERQQHAHEMQELQDHFNERQAVLQSEKNVLLEQLNTIRAQEKERYLETLEKMEKIYSDRRQEVETELEAIHQKLRAQQESHRAEQDALIEQLNASRVQQAQEHQRAIADLEKSYRAREQQLRSDTQAELDAEHERLQLHQKAFIAERNALIDQIGALRIEGTEKFRKALESLEQSFQTEQDRIRQEADDVRRKFVAQAGVAQLPPGDPRYQEELRRIEKASREKEERLRQQSEQERGKLVAQIGSTLREALEKPHLVQQPELLQEQIAEQIRRASEQYEQQLEERKIEFAKQNEEHQASLQGLREQLDKWHKIFNTNQPELALRSAQSSGWSKFAKKIAIAVLPICLISLIIGYWIYWQSGSDYLLPFSHPTGLVWQKDTLWVSDWYDQAVYQMHQDGKHISMIHRYTLPKSHITGLALVENKLYLVDSWNRQIQRWRIQEEQLTLETSWPSPGQSPSAIYFDGKDLWTSDKESHRIYRHSADEKLTVLNTYPIEHVPVGFYADSERFWSADEHSRLVYRHRWDPSLSVIGAYGLPELDEGKTPLSCFTLRGTHVWLGRDGSNALIERAWWRFKKRNTQ